MALTITTVQVSGDEMAVSMGDETASPCSFSGSAH